MYGGTTYEFMKKKIVNVFFNFMNTLFYKYNWTHSYLTSIVWILPHTFGHTTHSTYSYLHSIVCVYVFVQLYEYCSCSHKNKFALSFFFSMVLVQLYEIQLKTYNWKKVERAFVHECIFYIVWILILPSSYITSLIQLITSPHFTNSIEVINRTNSILLQ